MSFYNSQHLSLDEIIKRAGDDKGATILIPDLQRPYVWKPNQVVLLVDSLIRGWPFGTLLLWKVNHDDLSNIPSRAFWRVVDRTGDEKGETISKLNPPAEYHMVLDGQQRLQSLLIAFGGDSWGFKLYDRNWREEIEQKKPKGSPGIAHWSLGNLCLDIIEFGEAYKNAKNQLLGIDYTQVLGWVVNDAANGKSTTQRQSGYIEPLKGAYDDANKGRFIRLSRLWETAQPNPGLKEAQFRQLIDPVLTEHGVTAEVKDAIKQPLGELLQTFSTLRASMVNFLELQPYNPSITSRDDYNDSIVNIFTRLNTAGRTLTREEITFAWLKTGWEMSATGGRDAIDCVEGLKEELSEVEIKLDNDEIVGALSFVWSVCFNKGSLLSNRDLLRGETIRPMASQLSQNWATISNSVISTARQVHFRELDYQKQYFSFNALVVFCAWRYLLDEWIAKQQMKALQADSAQKKGDELLREFSDRWMFCSQWAGVWSASGGKILAAFSSQLSEDRDSIHNTHTIEEVVAVLRERMQEWLKGFELSASASVRSLVVAKRDQVRDYYPTLWLWHRLESNRWAASKITLRGSPRGKAKYDVDHIASVALLQKRFTAAKPDELKALGGVDIIPTLINSIGNCFLLEKTFNISKKEKPLADFLNQVHEFKEKKDKQKEWADALAISESQMLPDVADLPELVKKIEERENLIKENLVTFIAGNSSRIDVK